MTPFTIHRLAEEEVRKAAEYYENLREGLGREFRIAFEETLDRLRRNPGMPPPLDEQGTRKLRFRRFPYTIYYVELAESSWIAAVSHQKRRPGYWRSRKPGDESTS